ncbi:hypothetical protein GPECTOR_30g197 [Gonium pectorale]|uniref:Translation initiation factor eIF2B subunit epsilon n=1 Tax=Gonium pectorale TaxID=33097 RepID=A0A150GE39_GONPE|nr:hypothetical protein GPECTOR_30g197 [Gonium pectorale]|eukprot:KXZ48102.1 hypothetical protein GPECTOR_30g197 [Gonium pectorale]
MAPKRGGGGGERVEARTVLSAVLLADSFTQRFRPITVERPKALLPLVNVPMIEYALEWLAMNGVEECFVFCCAHADLIKRYLSDSKWANSRDMKVTPIVSTACLSAGEALRTIDQRDMIKGDFVLCSADVVSNMKLAPMLEAHRARRAADKNAIMTLAMKPVQHPSQRLRLGDTDLLVVLDATTQRLLKYTEIEPGRPVPLAKLDCALFSERDEVQVRSDLMDTHIAICSPEVLMLFSDNFDYQNIRRDFVSGVLSEEELGNKLHVYEVVGEYAARVHNLRSYDAVSRDLLQRWAFPFVPDTNALSIGGSPTWGQTSYRYSRGHRYLEATVSLARSTVPGEDVAIGAGTSIGEGSRVVQSVIGRNVRIGRNVDIVGCYVQDGVVIQDGVVLRSALVCEGAVLRSGCSVGAGAIISYGCVVDAKHVVAPHTRVSLCQQVLGAHNDSDDDLEYSTGTAAAAGAALGGGRGGPAGGMGRPAQGSSDDDEDDDDDDDDEDDDEDDNDSYQRVDEFGKSLERPSSNALRAAEALATGRQLAGDEAAVHFHVAAVGPHGAGYQWDPREGPQDLDRFSIAPPSLSLLTAEDVAAADEAAAAAAAGTSGADAQAGGGGGDGNGSAGDDSDAESDEGARDPERVWRREVEETFLRCIKMRFDVSNVVIELNGLKIAEDRTFADCARYMLTALLALGLPPPNRTPADYVPLFKNAAPDTSTQEGKLELLRTFKKALSDWRDLLQRFLRSEDDQVELLLTLEEYCNCEGVFEADGGGGALYAPIFAHILRQLYDTDVVSEESLLAWADEKAAADPEERRYVEAPDVARFLEWLREDDEEDEDEDD